MHSFAPLESKRKTTKTHFFEVAARGKNTPRKKEQQATPLHRFGIRSGKNPGKPPREPEKTYNEKEREKEAQEQQLAT